MKGRALVRFGILRLGESHRAHHQTLFVHPGTGELVTYHGERDTGLFRCPTGNLARGAGHETGFRDSSLVDKDHAFGLVVVTIVSEDRRTLVVQKERRARPTVDSQRQSSRKAPPGFLARRFLPEGETFPYREVTLPAMGTSERNGKKKSHDTYRNVSHG